MAMAILTGEFQALENIGKLMSLLASTDIKLVISPLENSILALFDTLRDFL